MKPIEFNLTKISKPKLKGKSLKDMKIGDLKEIDRMYKRTGGQRFWSLE